MVRCVYDECRSVSKLYLGIGNYSMIRYIDNKFCHVSSLHLVMGNVWSKVTRTSNMIFDCLCYIVPFLVLLDCSI